MPRTFSVPDMKVRRWNPQTREYEEKQIPDEWFCPMVLLNMEVLVNCTSCGKELFFGDTFCSRELHSRGGFGYPVCAACYEEEWKRAKEATDEQ